MSAKADNESNQLTTRESKEEVRETRRRKRIRERGSQTDEEAAGEKEDNHGCTLCTKKLDGIQEKLDKLLSLLVNLQNNAASTAAELAAASDKLAKVDEVEKRLIKQKCHNRRKNIKFFGIQDNDHESPQDSEKILPIFLRKEMKISSDELQEIEFERVHRIPTRPKKNQKQQPRPIMPRFPSPKTRNLLSRISRTCLKAKNMVYQTITQILPIIFRRHS